MIKEIEVLDQLLSIKLNGTDDVYQGICIAIADELHEAGSSYQHTFAKTKEVLQQAYLAWPKYSGDPDYPIRSDSDESAIAIYERYSYVYNMWNHKEYYGVARWELLDFMLDYFGSRLV